MSFDSVFNGDPTTLGVYASGDAAFGINLASGQLYFRSPLSNKAGWKPCGGTSNGTLSATISLSASQISGLAASSGHVPVRIVAAPGAGLAILPLYGFFIFAAGSSAWASGSQVDSLIGYDPATYASTNNSLLGIDGDTCFGSTILSGAGNRLVTMGGPADGVLGLSAMVNVPLNIIGGNGNWGVDGNGSATLTVYYIVVPA